MKTFFPFLVTLLSFNVLSLSYLIGRGIGDITGPSTEINFMGYAVPSQRGSGIHLRLRARTFIIADENKGKRVVYVSVDGGMGSDLVNIRVIDILKSKYGDLYSWANVCISGTHTHSGPAGFLQYVLYQMTSIGYVEETLSSWVNGIVASIEMAHNSLTEADIMVANSDLLESNINRSPTSYELNPAEERSLYNANTDLNMLLLKFVSSTKSLLGVLNWFAVHATSMNNTNTLVSGDNKGYASYALEEEINGVFSEPGKGPFIAAFASTNLGDVSPNTAGPKCIDTGDACDGSTSTCNGKCENCIAFGPGDDMFESTRIIGDQQYKHALGLMDEATEAIAGIVDFRQSFVTMPGLNVTVTSSTGETTTSSLCSPAMGYAFAAGTTDGPGMFGFTQGTTTGNPFWNKVRDFLSVPTHEEIKCHAPKPILINTGDVDKPYEWDPTTLSLQILRVGNLFILAVPSELTTMAGRRLRKKVEDLVRASGTIAEDQTIHVTIAGLANGYSSYVTTFEEYQAQRYEAASTIFGPHTLDAYLQEFARLTNDLLTGSASQSGPPPEDLSDQLIELMPPAKFDRVPAGTAFGDVTKDVLPSYSPSQIASAAFRSANPRNNPRAGGTFLKVQKSQTTVHDGKDFQSFSETWTDVAYDGDWETKFHWMNKVDDPLAFGVSGVSIATIEWAIPTGAYGTYRICHYGDSKQLLGGSLTPFEGCSSSFQVA